MDIFLLVSKLCVNNYLFKFDSIRFSKIADDGAPGGNSSDDSSDDGAPGGDSSDSSD